MGDVRGYHVALDGIFPQSKVGICPSRAVDFLDLVAKETGLNVILGPFSKERDAIVHGFCIIAESHISLEADRLTGAFFFDLFSCQPIPGKAVIEAMRFFQPVRWRLRRIKRGTADVAVAV